MIKVSLNNQCLVFEDSITVLDLLARENFQANKIAVAVNGEFVARHDYATLVLCNNDAVDVLAPVQGG